MLSWFKWREAVLRKLVSERDPIPVFKSMMRIGDFYIDISVDHAKFKVKASR